MTVKIQALRVNEFLDRPESTNLLEEYAQECAITGLPKPKPDLAIYALMEERELLHLLVAMHDDEIVGFVVALVSANPHYSAVLCVVESLFVAKERRKGGAGLALLGAVKALAKERGAVGLLSSAPAGGVLSDVYAGMDCKHTNNVFFWEIENGG